MTPDKVALVYRGQATTYRELARRTNRLAHGLRSLGVGRGDRVAYLGLNSTPFIETLFAVAKLGAVFLPCNTRLSAGETEYILADSGATTLVWDEPFGETMGPDFAGWKLQQVSVSGKDGLTSLEGLIESGSDEPLDEQVAHEDLFMLQYTSGTTGYPKGVMLTHGNITWNVYNLIVDVDLGADEVCLLNGPLFHTATLNQILLPTLLKGGRCLVEEAWDTDRTLDLIESEGVTFMFGVPTTMLNMVQHPRWAETDKHTLRSIIGAGAPLPEPLLQAFADSGLPALQGYGLTESSPGATMLRAADSMRKIGSAGTSCFWTDVRVVDDRGRPVTADESGEVLVQGPNVTPGYWQLPEATADVFTEDRWLRTGDMARVDDEGYIYIVDRLKDMIISGGENIYPAEVETALYENPAIAEAAVIGVPDERWGEVPRAVIVLREGHTTTEADVLARLDGRLARYKRPKSVVFLDALPHNASGKLLKRELRDRFGAPTSA